MNTIVAAETPLIRGKGAYLYVVSYIEGANSNIILPADDPERLAHAERIADAAVAAGLTYVMIKVADGRRPYNRRNKSAGEVIYNSILPEGVDDCPLVVKALQRRGIKVYGWQFIYGQDPESEASMAIQRINELGLDGWVVNAEYAHKSYLQNGKVVDGYKLDRSQPSQEVTKPPAAMILKVGAYMAPVRAECHRLRIPLYLSSYKFPTVHPSFPFAAFLEYCDGNMAQVYPIGDTSPIAHTQQLARSLREYREIAPGVPNFPTGGAFSEGYEKNGKKISWTATPDQVRDFFGACLAEGLPAASIWEWSAARERFPELWNAMAEILWPGSEQEPVIVVPPVGAGDPPTADQLAERTRELWNRFRIRVPH